jgi:hypothetical protein
MAVCPGWYPLKKNRRCFRRILRRTINQMAMLHDYRPKDTAEQAGRAQGAGLSSRVSSQLAGCDLIASRDLIGFA